MEKSSQASGGIGCFGVLFLILAVLKIFGLIGISWWWVTAPLWGPVVVLIAAAAFLFMIGGIMSLISRGK